MYRTRAFRRHQNVRVIRKRLKIMKRIWKAVGQDVSYLYEMQGKYRKFNTVCSCGMCDQNRPFKHKRVPSISEESTIKAKDAEIQEYLEKAS